MKAPTHVEVSRPDKLLWPALAITKRDYVAYLHAVAPHMVPWLRGRPLTVVRAPDGVDGQRYFQKAASSHTPAWIRTVRIPAPSAKRDVDYVVCDHAATLAWLGNQAALEFHPAPVRADRLDRLDLLTVDLDPPEGAFAAAAEVALVVLEVLGGPRHAGRREDDRRQGPARRRADRAPVGPGGPAPGGRDGSPRSSPPGCPDAVTDEFRKADRGGRVIARPLAQRRRRDRRRALLTAHPARGHGVVPGSRPEQLGSVAPEDFTLATATALLDGPGPKAWDDLVTRRSRVAKELLADD